MRYRYTKPPRHNSYIAWMMMMMMMMMAMICVCYSNRSLWCCRLVHAPNTGTTGFHALILLTGYWHVGTGIRGLMRGMATLPQGYQELLMVRDEVGRPPGELGISKSMECDILPSVLWRCWLGDRKGIRPVKNWMLVCWWWWFDWSFAWLKAPAVQLLPPPPSSFASISTG